MTESTARAGGAFPVQARLRTRLLAAFAPLELVITDESAQHAGHAGHRPEGETHFHVRMVSDAFAGQSRVERQRAVHAVLADELRDRVHALVLELRTPAEAAAR